MRSFHLRSSHKSSVNKMSCSIHPFLLNTSILLLLCESIKSGQKSLRQVVWTPGGCQSAVGQTARALYIIGKERNPSSF